MKSLNALGEGTQKDELSGAITGQRLVRASAVCDALPGLGSRCAESGSREPGQLSQEMDSSTPCLDKKATSCGSSAQAQPATED